MTTSHETTTSATIERLNRFKAFMEALSGAVSTVDLNKAAESVDEVSEAMEAVVSRLADVMPEYDMISNTSVDRRTGAIHMDVTGEADHRGIISKIDLNPEEGVLVGHVDAFCRKGGKSLVVSPDGCHGIIGAVLRAVKRFADVIDEYDIHADYRYDIANGDVKADARMDFKFFGRYQKSIELSFGRVDGKDTSRVRVLKKKDVPATAGTSSEEAA